uniref:Uncharacterized protein n=1 Tax=mine drainage metagenome TaxID=410659 RepID=E6Q4G2_9ZZZZ
MQEDLVTGPFVPRIEPEPAPRQKTTCHATPITSHYSSR